MKNFDPILKRISFKRNNHYRTYVIDKDILILVKSRHITSSVYKIRELVSISFLAQECQYSCILLGNENIQIKKEES
ncbi:MAG: hypothetical protein HRT43_12420 [Campylobacteraceae bacterium]|nr:hypothetical protein [Campylobacteraceae bacterium]